MAAHKPDLKRAAVRGEALAGEHAERGAGEAAGLAATESRDGVADGPLLRPLEQDRDLAPPMFGRCLTRRLTRALADPA